MFKVMATYVCVLLLSTSAALAVMVVPSANEPASVYEMAPSPDLSPAPKVDHDQTKSIPLAKSSESVVSSRAHGPSIAPRFEIYARSVAKLMSEAKRSHAGPLVQFIEHLAIAMSQRSSEGIDAQAAAGLLSQAAEWPDTSVEAVTFAPDLQGRSRWAIRVHWPMTDAYDRMKLLLGSQAGQDLFDGITIQPRDVSGYTVTLRSEPIAYLLPQGSNQAIIVSHDDLSFPQALFSGDSTGEEDSSYLLTARLNLTETEKDSGATFFSSLHLLKSVDYAAFVDSRGVWQETVRVHWPPIVGIGAKTMMGKVHKSFFVPRQAFGAVTVSSLTFPSMLEGMAGFGPQVFMEQPGQVEIANVDESNELTLGPIASRASNDICVTVLPGTGFLPVPDVVVQTRMTNADTFMADVRETVASINELFRQRDQKEPWHEIEVRSQPAFYREATNVFGPMFLPLVMRPVIFSHRDTDAKGKERDYLVLAWTSTSPESLVKRWSDFPRMSSPLYLPNTRKSHGQAWVNWKLVYQWVAPYINTALSSTSTEVMLPGVEELGVRLSNAWLTSKITYRGLNTHHAGPIPLGAIVVPSMFATSLVMDRSQNSDLARERVASQRLKVLYHHAKLFRKDIGRWPAEVGELDGYVDFAGHPELLHMRVSSKRAWSEFFSDMFPKSSDDMADMDDEEDAGKLVDINDDLYVIHWGKTRWTLGYAPGTFDHLAKLYINQDGDIVRVEASLSEESAENHKRSGKDDTPKVSPTVTSTERPAR